MAGGYDGVLARAPVRLLRGDLAQTGDAAGRVERALPRAKTALAGIATAVADMRAFIGAEAMAWEEMLQLGAFCRAIAPIAEAGRLAILDAGDPSAGKLVAALQKVSKLEAAAAACEAASGWPKDADVPDLQGLIAAAKKHEGKFFAFLSGDWRRAKRAVRTNYKGKSESVAMALLQLAEMQRTAVNRDRARAEMEKECGFAVSPEIHAALERAWTAGSELTDVERDAVRICLCDADAAVAVQRLASQSAGLRRVEGGAWRHLLRPCAADPSGHRGERGGAGRQYRPDRRVCGPAQRAGQDRRRRSRKLCAPRYAAGADRGRRFDSAINSVFRRNRALDRFDSAKLEEIVADLQKRHGDLRRLNSQFAVNASHQGFHERRDPLERADRGAQAGRNPLAAGVQARAQDARERIPASRAPTSRFASCSRARPAARSAA